MKKLLIFIAISLLISCKKDKFPDPAVTITEATLHNECCGKATIHMIGTLPNITDSLWLYEGAGKVLTAHGIKSDKLELLFIINKKRSYEFTFIAFPSGISGTYNFTPKN